MIIIFKLKINKSRWSEGKQQSIASHLKKCNPVPKVTNSACVMAVVIVGRFLKCGLTLTTQAGLELMTTLLPQPPKCHDSFCQFSDWEQIKKGLEGWLNR